MATQLFIVGWTAPFITKIVSVKLPAYSTLQGAPAGDNNTRQLPYLGETLATIEIETQDIETAQALDGTTIASPVTITAHLNDNSTVEFNFKSGLVVCEPQSVRNRTIGTATLRIGISGNDPANVDNTIDQIEP
jgi:hypothetical protein